MPKPQTVEAALFFSLTTSNVDGLEAVVWLHPRAKVKVLLTTFAGAEAFAFHRQVSVIAEYGVKSFPEIQK